MFPWDSCCGQQVSLSSSMVSDRLLDSSCQEHLRTFLFLPTKCWFIYLPSILSCSEIKIWGISKQNVSIQQGFFKILHPVFNEFQSFAVEIYEVTTLKLRRTFIYSVSSQNWMLLKSVLKSLHLQECLLNEAFSRIYKADSRKALSEKLFKISGSYPKWRLMSD